MAATRHAGDCLLKEDIDEPSSLHLETARASARVSASSREATKSPLLKFLDLSSPLDGYRPGRESLLAQHKPPIPPGSPIQPYA
jgi:hypothetical protein